MRTNLTKLRLSTYFINVPRSTVCVSASSSRDGKSGER
jgi:hypothetical protein